MRIRPLDVPEHRDATLTWWRKPQLVAELEAVLADPGRLRTLARRQSRAEREFSVWVATHHAWLSGVPLPFDTLCFHVSEEAAELICQAAESLPEFILQPHDLISRSGYLLFAAPVTVGRSYAFPGLDLTVQGFLWHPCTGVDEALAFAPIFERPMVRAMDALEAAGQARLDKHTGPQASRDSSEADRPMPPLVPSYTHLPLFGRAMDANPHDDSSDGARVTALFASLLCMMRQKNVIDESTVTTKGAGAERKGRKRTKVKPHRAPQPIRVLKLRTSAGGGQARTHTQEWKHKWVVRGHWRNHYYPSIKENRPVWITAYVKGPDDKPLIGGERVYSM